MAKRHFSAALAQVRRRWRTGLALGVLLRAAGHAAVAAAVLGLLDFFLAFEPGVCLALVAAAVGVIVVILSRGLVRIGRLGAADAAERADALLRDRRQPVLSALELEGALSRSRDRLPALQIYLMEQSIGQAGEDLSRLRFRDQFPFPEVGRALRRALAAAAVVAALTLANPLAARVVAARLLTPLRDTPPYSRFAFQVSPDSPSIVYGGDAEVSVRIAGAPVRAPVWFLTRDRGRVHRTACFQESGGRYAQKLERIVSPVEFAFATGRARSRWHRVNLLLQPEIASVDITVIPPPYTGRPRRYFRAGQEALAGYKRSQVEIAVRSNRPLADGVLTLRPKHGLAGDRVIAGTRKTMDTLLFAWSVEEDARVEVSVRDVQGTRNREPLALEQRLTPDKPPEVSITEPGGFSLATPGSTLTLAGRASDDLGLRKVELVRTVVGYRDRMAALAGPQAGSSFSFARKIDLGTLGVQPGQVLEFYLEAADTNPDLTGVAASDIARVQIISENEYAEMLRARTAVAEVLQRYRTIESLLKRFTDGLEDLIHAAATGNAEPAAIEKRIKTARDAGARTADELMKIAMDFPLYDMEKNLKEPLLGMVDLIRQEVRVLDGARAPYEDMVPALRAMLDALRAGQAPVDQQILSAAEAEVVARVMEMAAIFKDLVRQQSELVRRLERFSRESADKDTKLLGGLGKREEDVRGGLLKFVEELRGRAGALPDEYAALRKDAEGFAARVLQHEIAEILQKAANRAENRDGKGTYESAKLALERLQELMRNSEGGAYGGMMQNKMRFDVKKALQETLEQMLGAILARSGAGQGTPRSMGLAGGGMIGGDVNDGYWSGGQSPLNVPVFGPDRMSYPPPDSRTGGWGIGSGGPGSGAGVTTPATSETLGAREAASARGESLPAEALPEKYRQAIKRYFRSMEERHE